MTYEIFTDHFLLDFLYNHLSMIGLWINFIHEILTSMTGVRIRVTVLAGSVMVLYKTTYIVEID